MLTRLRYALARRRFFSGKVSAGVLVDVLVASSHPAEGLRQFAAGLDGCLRHYSTAILDIADNFEQMRRGGEALRREQEAILSEFPELTQYWDLLLVYMYTGSFSQSIEKEYGITEDCVDGIAECDRAVQLVYWLIDHFRWAKSDANLPGWIMTFLIALQHEIWTDVELDQDLNLPSTKAFYPEPYDVQAHDCMQRIYP